MVVLEGELHEVPVLNRTDKPWKLWETYSEEHPNPKQNNKKEGLPSEQATDHSSPKNKSKKTNKNRQPAQQSIRPEQSQVSEEATTTVEASWKPGRGTFLALLDYVTEESRSKACLSYYYVRLIESFALYKQLVSDMERVHVQALWHYDELFHCETNRASVRLQLQHREVYASKRDELDTILAFAKYKLQDHLQLEHTDCGGIGQHCIRHGLCSCDHKDHDQECGDCLKFLRCPYDLKHFLQYAYNDLCRAFEKELPEWYPREHCFQVSRCQKGYCT
jgi:hypothetical protein